MIVGFFGAKNSGRMQRHRCASCKAPKDFMIYKKTRGKSHTLAISKCDWMPTPYNSSKPAGVFQTYYRPAPKNGNA